ncbi:hypothetical protein BHE74_00032355 [Ensete ventricosum]|nr:hypothetical protein BHE74_00032355 [Ensete ventricosum]
MAQSYDGCSGPESSSSGVMTGTDAKVRQALETMKLHHDFDSTVCLESLGSIQKHLVFRVSMSFMLRGRGNGRTTLVPGGSVSLSMPWRRG